MPSSWGELPQELLESIIDKIGDDCALIAPTVRNRCLIQLQLTCKRWSSVAREVFYNDEFEINVDLAKKLVSCGRNHRQKLWRLKKIMITYELALDVTLKKLLSMCPNLTHLCVLEQPYTDTDSTGSTGNTCTDTSKITTNSSEITYAQQQTHLMNENVFILL